MGAKDQVTAEELLEAMGTLRRLVRTSAGRPWPDADLTGAEVDLVRLVRRRPHIGVAQAAGVLGLAPNSVSTLVRRLSDAGLLVGERDPADRRVARLTLTAEALGRVEAWRDERTSLVARALGELSPADQRGIATAVPALGRLTEVLRRVGREGA